jgi:hypothetical protein
MPTSPDEGLLYVSVLFGFSFLWAVALASYGCAVLSYASAEGRAVGVICETITPHVKRNPRLSLQKYNVTEFLIHERTANLFEPFVEVYMVYSDVPVCGPTSARASTIAGEVPQTRSDDDVLHATGVSWRAKPDLEAWS